MGDEDRVEYVKVVKGRDFSDKHVLEFPDDLEVRTDFPLPGTRVQSLLKALDPASCTGWPKK